VTATCGWDPAALRITRMVLQVEGPGAGPGEAIACKSWRSRRSSICPVSNALRGNVEIVLEV
jgi:organic hydroperoxide reductase OsmC/OhrA